MKRLIMLTMAVAGLNVLAQSETKVAGDVHKVALVVQNHAATGAEIPMMALTDVLTAKLAGRGMQVVNPYNAIGTNLNRTSAGEKMPEASAIEVARKLGANGAITASVHDFNDTTFGTPPVLHQYTVRVSLSLADAQTGAAVCGATVKSVSPKYTNSQVAANRQEYLGDLLNAAAGECAEKLVTDPAVAKWTPAKAKPAPPPRPPADPNLTIDDIDAAVKGLLGDMRLSGTFRAAYDKTQKEIDRMPLAIVGGLVDLTGGKSPCADIENLLAAGSQTVRMALVASSLFEAKDDEIAGKIAKRVIAGGNSPLEDGELMAVLKQHASPDFFVVGDLRFFAGQKADIFRLRLAVHDIHNGKIAWEGVKDVEKPSAAPHSERKE